MTPPIDMVPVRNYRNVTSCQKDGTAMSRLAKVIRNHREINRNERALNRVLDSASPAMRDEILVLVQRQNLMR
ncbi:MAG: hypothetical protein ACR2P2_16245 [Nakamurella sp.]